MNSRLLPILLLALVWGCDADAPTPPEVPGDTTVYHQPTAPESLLANLETAYKRREFDHYLDLLAPEFVFYFQPQDANIIGAEYWTRSQDSTGTRALLTTNQVASIRLHLFYGTPDTTIDTPGTPVDSAKVRIITTDLQVDQMDGITWVVADQQDFYFRKGLASQGEAPGHWLIYKWQDLPTLFSAASTPTPVSPTTWGKLKSLF